MKEAGPEVVDQRELCGLIARVDQIMDAHVRAVADQLGITSSQAVALRELDQPLTLKELASRMCCEASNAGYVVDRMSEQGLITRNPHPSDRRAKLISLTDGGQGCRSNVLRALQDQSPTAALTLAEAKQLTTLLGKVVG